MVKQFPKLLFSRLTWDPPIITARKKNISASVHKTEGNILQSVSSPSSFNLKSHESCRNQNVLSVSLSHPLSLPLCLSLTYNPYTCLSPSIHILPSGLSIEDISPFCTSETGVSCPCSVCHATFFFCMIFPRTSLAVLKLLFSRPPDNEMHEGKTIIFSSLSKFLAYNIHFIHDSE